MTGIARAARGLWWYLRTVSGESRWDEYLAGCQVGGVEPMTRRAFERHRADVREHHPAARCC